MSLGIDNGSSYSDAQCIDIHPKNSMFILWIISFGLSIIPTTAFLFQQMSVYHSDLMSKSIVQGCAQLLIFPAFTIAGALATARSKLSINSTGVFIDYGFRSRFLQWDDLEYARYGKAYSGRVILIKLIDGDNRKINLAHLSKLPRGYCTIPDIWEITSFRIVGLLNEAKARSADQFEV